MTDSLLAISLRTLLWALGSTLLAFFPAIALAYLLARKDFLLSAVYLPSSAYQRCCLRLLSAIYCSGC